MSKWIKVGIDHEDGMTLWMNEYADEQFFAWGYQVPRHHGWPSMKDELKPSGRSWINGWAWNDKTRRAVQTNTPPEDETDVPDEAPGGEVRTVSRTGGEKGMKLARYDLIPTAPLKALAEHYAKGAEKYDDNQWRKGYEFSKSFAALQRHAWQWWNGEDTDEETGSSHLTAVAWHAFALLEFMSSHPDFDDRYKKGE